MPGVSRLTLVSPPREAAATCDALPLARKTGHVVRHARRRFTRAEIVATVFGALVAVVLQLAYLLAAGSSPF